MCICAHMYIRLLAAFKAKDLHVTSPKLATFMDSSNYSETYLLISIHSINICLTLSATRNSVSDSGTIFFDYDKLSSSPIVWALLAPIHQLSIHFSGFKI